MAAKNATKKMAKPKAENKNSKSKKNEAPSSGNSQKKQIFFVFLFAFSVLMASDVMIEAKGLWGVFRNFFFGMFGFSAFFLPFFLVFLSVVCGFGKSTKKFKYAVVEGFIIYVLIMALVDIVQTDSNYSYWAQITLAYSRFKTYTGTGIHYGSGVIGAVFGGLPLLITDGNKVAAGIIDGVFLFSFVVIFFGTTLIKTFHSLKKPAKAVAEYAGEKAESLKESYETVSGDVAEYRARISERNRKRRSEKATAEFPMDIPISENGETRNTELDDIFNKKDEIPRDSEKKTKRKKKAEVNIDEPLNIDFLESFENSPKEKAPPLDELFNKTKTDTKLEEHIEDLKEETKEKLNKNDIETAREETEKEIAENTLPEKDYNLPPLDCLNEPKQQSSSDNKDEANEKAKIIVNTLNSFGVGTHIVNICHSPSVTRFELQPDPGVKISRITALADDIAMNLASSGVRIEAPIPNKNAVGIEVPNSEKAMVTLREIIDTPAYRNAKSKLYVALGRDIQGEPTYCDIAKMPHLLVAGTTGSGKSVCLNSMIVSILYNATPDEVKLVLIDPKKVEFTMYQGIPHLLIPVVSDPRKAAGALSWAVAEMDKRYALFAENGVRNIQGYNTLASSECWAKMPQIVIVIDEFSDLMMVASNEVEELVCRLAQKARAAGMHLIVATQRPSVDVITGLIKANIPSRIALSVKSQIDSRTIIDIQGAEKLLGNGDMLYCPVGLSKPVRVQGAYLSDDEIESVIEYVKTQGDASYDDDVIREIEIKSVKEDKKKGASVNTDITDDDSDEMTPKAIAVVVEAGMASTTLLQKRLKLGYARASRIIDELSEKGIIGPYEGSKPRKVLITKEQWLEMQANSSFNMPKQLTVDDIPTAPFEEESDEDKPETFTEHNYFGNANNQNYEEDDF